MSSKTWLDNKPPWFLGNRLDFRCKSCNHKFKDIDDNEQDCPMCGSKDLNVKKGSRIPVINQPGAFSIKNNRFYNLCSLDEVDRD